MEVWQPRIKAAFIQTGRRGRDGQPGWRRCTARQKLADLEGEAASDGPSGGQSRWGRCWWSGWSHIKGQINQEEQLGSEIDFATQGSSTGQISLKTCGGCSSKRNSQPHRRIHWSGPQDLRMYTSSPIWESPPEGFNLLVFSGESGWKQGKTSASGIVLSLTPPPHSAPQRSSVDCTTLGNIKALSLITGVPRQKNMPQVKEQIKTPEKQLSKEEIANLSDHSSKQW